MDAENFNDIKQKVLAIVRKGNQVTISDIGYRFENRMDDRKKMSKKIIHDVLAELISEGQVVEQYHSGTKRYKPSDPNMLDSVFGMVAKPINSDLVVRHTPESMGPRPTSYSSGVYGYRSYWEAVDWPSPAGW